MPDESERSVLQPWLETIPIRMQSTLLLSLRGPDSHRCPEVKRVQRWMRSLAFRPGNPDNVCEFMTSPRDVPDIVEKGPLAQELEFCSQHFYSHLMHGLEVLAYRHPVTETKQRAYSLFLGLCTLLHLPAESKDAFEARLGTREWPSGQPDNYEDAIAALDAAKEGS